MKSIKLLLLIAAVSAFATTSGQINYENSRRLDEGWLFLRGDIGNIWEAVRPVPEGGAESVPIWSEVSLPHCFNAEDAVDPDVNYYEGPGWYRTRLDIDNPYEDGRTLLHFEGAGQRSEVWVYMTKVGEHTGGYDEWTVDITDAVAEFLASDEAGRFDGLVPVSIRCDNTRNAETIPSDLSDFNVYGGIYRYLNLVYTPAAAIKGIHVDAATDSKGKAGTIVINACFENIGDASELTLQILDPAGKVVHRVNYERGELAEKMTLPAVALKKPALWSPSSPNLYTIELSLVSPSETMTCREVFGFRHFEFVEHGPFMLNGQRLLLRGTHRHEDHAGVGAAMDEATIVREMEMMKQMGVNFIRLGHYQQSRIVLEACDRLGILVWEEIPWCRGGLGGDTYKAQAERMLRNMITQHRNHPSVILWGLGNENDWPNDFPTFDKDAIRTFMKNLHDLAHSIDDTRLTSIRRCDFCKDIVDVYSPSIWAGWYGGVYTDYKSTSLSNMEKVKHFLHVEWGGDSHAGRHAENPYAGLGLIMPGGNDERAGDASLHGGRARASRDGDWSETYICDLIDWHLKEQETMPWLTGAAYWPFKDFSTPLRPENPVPYVNQKGVVERDLTPKEAFYVFQSYWTEKPIVHIYGHSWLVRWGDEDEIKTIKVYSNCPEVELFLNGKSLGRRVRNSADFPAAGLRWNTALLSGQNELRAVGYSGKEKIEDTVELAYETRKWGEEAAIEVSATDNGDGTVWIDARLVDAAGVPCLDSRSYIEFSAAGNGRLVQNMGTSTGSRKLQAFNGRARIKLERGERGGKTVVAVKSGNLPTAFVSIIDYKTQITNLLRSQILEEAAWAMAQEPETVTASPCERSEGGLHDFYSEGDYWWPNPADPEGPYIRCDGETNPENFIAHRLAMIRFSRVVGAIASAYLLTGDDRYVEQAFRHIRAWFCDPATRMNADLRFAQAIKGVTPGRGVGIIDTIHFMEVAQGIIRMAGSPAADPNVVAESKKWFAEYLEWMATSKNGLDELNAKNNHSVCWVMQAASFARLTGDKGMLEFCRARFADVLLPDQMATGGSFPREIERTKPYGYSLFNLDAMTAICRIISHGGGGLWEFTTPDGRNIRQAVDFMFPYIADKSSWPYGEDVMYGDEWPVAQPSLLFAAAAYGDDSYFELWKRLPHRIAPGEVERNVPIRYPLIWF